MVRAEKAVRTPTRSISLESARPSLLRDAFSLVKSKLSVPLLSDGIPRTQLTDRLCSHTGPLATAVAAPGYGKTTLLAQWVQQDPRP